MKKSIATIGVIASLQTVAASHNALPAPVACSGSAEKEEETYTVLTPEGSRREIRLRDGSTVRDLLAELGTGGSNSSENTADEEDFPLPTSFSRVDLADRREIFVLGEEERLRLDSELEPAVHSHRVTDLFMLEKPAKRRAERLAARGRCNAFRFADAEYCGRYMDPVPRTWADAEPGRTAWTRENLETADEIARFDAAFDRQVDKCNADARCFFTPRGTKVLAKTVVHSGQWNGIGVQQKTGMSDAFRVAEVTRLQGPWQRGGKNRALEFSISRQRGGKIRALAAGRDFSCRETRLGRRAIDELRGMGLDVDNFAQIELLPGEETESAPTPASEAVFPPGIGAGETPASEAVFEEGARVLRKPSGKLVGTLLSAEVMSGGRPGWRVEKVDGGVSIEAEAAMMVEPTFAGLTLTEGLARGLDPRVFKGGALEEGTEHNIPYAAIVPFANHDEELHQRRPSNTSDFRAGDYVLAQFPHTFSLEADEKFGEPAARRARAALLEEKSTQPSASELLETIPEELRTYHFARVVGVDEERGELCLDFANRKLLEPITKNVGAFVKKYPNAANIDTKSWTPRLRGLNVRAAEVVPARNQEALAEHDFEVWKNAEVLRWTVKHDERASRLDRMDFELGLDRGDLVMYTQLLTLAGLELRYFGTGYFALACCQWKVMQKFGAGSAFTLLIVAAVVGAKMRELGYDV